MRRKTQMITLYKHLFVNEMVNVGICIILLSAVIEGEAANDPKLKDADLSRDDDSDSSDDHSPEHRYLYRQGGHFGDNSDSTKEHKGQRASHPYIPVKVHFGSPNGHLGLPNGPSESLGQPFGSSFPTGSFNRPEGPLSTRVNSFDRPVGVNNDPGHPFKGGPMSYNYPTGGFNRFGGPFHPDSSMNAYFSHRSPFYSPNTRVGSPYHDDLPTDHAGALNGFFVHPDSLLNDRETFNGRYDPLSGQVSSLSGQIDRNRPISFSGLPSYLGKIPQTSSQRKLPENPLLRTDDFSVSSSSTHESADDSHPSNSPRNAPSDPFSHPSSFNPTPESSDKLKNSPEVTVLANLAYTYSIDPSYPYPGISSDSDTHRDASNYRPFQGGVKPSPFPTGPTKGGFDKGNFNRPTKGGYSPIETRIMDTKKAPSNIKGA